MKIRFRDQQKKHQIRWREDNISTKEWGTQNGRRYEYIIPKGAWEENLWIGIRAELKKYLAEKDVQAHTGKHNLCESVFPDPNGAGIQAFEKVILTTDQD